MSCGDPHDTDCGEVLGRLYEYLDHEMADLDCEKIQQHLHECAPCLQEFDLDQVVRDLIRRSCACEPAPRELRTRILTRITQIRVEYDV